MPSEPRVIFRRVLVGYTLFIATVLLAPVPTVASGVVGGTEGVLSAFGLPTAVTEPGRVEFLLNAAMFAPIANLAALAWPRHPWANWVVYAFLASLAVETIQGLLLPARSAQFEDVVANALGAVVGAWCSTLVVPVLYDDHAASASAVRWWVQRRSRAEGAAMLRGIMTRVLGGRGTAGSRRPARGRSTVGSTGGVERGGRSLLRGLSRRRRVR